MHTVRTASREAVRPRHAPGNLYCDVPGRVLALTEGGGSLVKKPSDATFYLTSPSRQPSDQQETDATLPRGAQIGEYIVEAVIGAGGFGTVYRAIHPVIAKQAAIKVLSLRYSVDPQIVSRFIAEARAVNQIGHEHIIDIFSFGELPDRRRYYVMEYLQGAPLDEHLEQNGALPIQDTLSILEPIARALDATHASGIAHRDLKPANVYLTQRAGAWFPKLLDFGIAKLMDDRAPPVSHHTAPGTTVGTPYFMSPEQCMGAHVDHRTDHYAFGVMAFQMLTGKRPFDAPTPAEVMVHHMTTAPPAPSSVRSLLPKEFDRLVLSLLAKQKEDRPAQLTPVVHAMLEAAGYGIHPGITPKHILRPEPITEHSAPAQASAGPSGSRRWWILGVVLGVLVCLLWWTRLDDASLSVMPVRATPVTVPDSPPTTMNPVPDPPSTVRVAFESIPQGAFVLLRDGSRVPINDGSVILPYGTDSFRLTIKAPGYAPRGVVLVPNQDQRIDAGLTRIVEAPRRPQRSRPPKKRQNKSRRPGADDLLGWEE